MTNSHGKSIGKTIRIYLADGVPTGIRHAEIVNWTGQAIVCPRARIGELSDWKESQRPGIYILFGHDPESTKQLAYIGEAENVQDRLRNHVIKKDFWDEVIFFTSKDENLTKAHVKYLESRILEIVKSINRITLENSNSPLQPSLPRSDRDSMEEFIDPIRLLLTALGRPILQPLRKTQAPQPSDAQQDAERTNTLTNIQFSLIVPKTGVNATGFATDEGFVVGKESVGASTTKTSLNKGYYKLREDLIASGDVDVNAEGIHFVRDVLFQSPSAAASVLAGVSLNGRSAWRDQHNHSLGAIEKQILKTVQKTVEPLLNTD